MSEQTEQEIRRIAWCMTEQAHFGRSTVADPPPCAVIPAWRMEEARAAYHLGARHDGRGEMHGPVRALGDAGHRLVASD